MIYVTGDTHGDLERFRTPAARRLRRGDTLLVCGDFGFIWNGSKEEEKALDWLAKRKYTILFVEGTHDNLQRLADYPTQEVGGAPARQIRGNVFQLLRGNVYQVEGRTIFAMGGGESDDLDVREEGVTWWPEEMPTQEELALARQSLAAHQNQVDWVITHECSARLLSFLEMDKAEDERRVNPLTTFFNEVEQTCQFRCWYFGGHHLDKPIPPRHLAVFQTILPAAGQE